MDVQPQPVVGAFISGIEPDNLSSLDVDALRDNLAVYGVLVMRQQVLSDTQFVKMLRAFGPPQVTEGEATMPGFPMLNVVTNTGRRQAPVSNWHTDTAYVKSPPSFTALRAVKVPSAGGQTQFSNQIEALETLPETLRNAVWDASLTHVVTGVELPDDAEQSSIHPLVRQHPRTGRPALFLDAPRRCQRVSGMDESTSRALITELLDWSTRAENTWSHTWAEGDVVIWDNAVVLHRADHSNVVGDRTMHRGMVDASGYGTVDSA